MSIHSTALIDDGVAIGSSVDIDAYSVIRKGVIIGSGSKIGTHVEIAPYTKIGINNQVFKGAYLGASPQDIKYQAKKKNNILLKIGNNNLIREYVTIHHGTERTTDIGNNNLFMAQSHIAHDCSVGNDIILANYVALAGWVRVEDHAFISGHTLVHQHVRIGRFAMIGGLCRISQDVPPFALIAQENAKLYGINKNGLKKNNWNDERIIKIKKIYKALFQRGISLKSGIQNIIKMKNQVEFKSVIPEVNELIHFIENTNRGIISKWGAEEINK